jgi:hypothetical protein
MVKDSSFKLIAMISRKIILEKRISKYQAIIEDIDEYLQDHLNSTKNIKDFEGIFNKLKSEYKSKLVDTSDEGEDEDNDDENEKMDIVKSNNTNDIKE